MMVVALGYLGFLAHMNVVLTDQQIAAMRVDRVKSVHSAVSYDLELNLKHAAALAGYRVGMAGGEPGELEPLAKNLLNERIARGFEYEVVRVEVPLAADNSHSLNFREDGSYATNVELDGEVEHVAGDVKLRGFKARASVQARWMLLYRLVRQEHPLNVAAAEQALASGQDVGQVLKQRELELNERYAGEGIGWEVSWGSVTTIARDARVGPVVIVDGQKVPMAYRMSSEVSVSQPGQPQAQPQPQPQSQPVQPTDPEPTKPSVRIEVGEPELKGVMVSVPANWLGQLFGVRRVGALGWQATAIIAVMGENWKHDEPVSSDVITSKYYLDVLGTATDLFLLRYREVSEKYEGGAQALAVAQCLERLEAKVAERKQMYGIT